MHVYQGKAGAIGLGLDRDDMLVFLGADFQFDILTVAIPFTLEFFGFTGRVVLEIVALRMTLQHTAILILQNILVISHDFAGRIVRFIFDSHNFQRKAKAGNIDIGALFVAFSFFQFRTGAGINRKAGVSHIGIVVDMDPAERRTDVHFLVLAVVTLFHVDTASRQKYQHKQ